MRAHGYVIHTRPFQDNKVLLDVFTRELGLIRVVWRLSKKEARVTPGSFLLYEIELAGRGELKTAHSMEQETGNRMLTGVPLYSAFYVHELLEKLLPHNLPVDPLFELYEWLITNLHADVPVAPLLRRFEVGLFEELGVAIDMTATSRGKKLEAKQLYQFHSKFGLQPYFGEQPKLKPLIYVDGRVALQYAAGEWHKGVVLKMAKELHRAWLDIILGGRKLNARTLLPTAQYEGERLWHVPVFRSEGS